MDRTTEGLAEIVMLHTSLLMGGRLDVLDRYHGWRLDIDKMTYEDIKWLKNMF
ncbi:hypothetical protein BT93_D2058 [Corymbia citriodora subsp. variegata]|nr:hypothetical protein BT93_D2058 [Corymbia citriodora subsp. variegata]